MISPRAFHDWLTAAGVNFITGVPDSLLKDFCAYAAQALPADRHVIAANEGSAVALASGVHMALGGIPLVYLQNSGLGNAVNPLLSLADPDVYAIPMLLLVGWRGEPGVKDEPQHITQGRVSPAMLAAMDIPFWIFDGQRDQARSIVDSAVAAAKARSGPAVLLVRKGAFSAADMPPETAAVTVEASESFPVRETVIEEIINLLPRDALVISSTGHISRELYDSRNRHGHSRAGDFMTVGSMGHASQIALGIALNRQDRPVVCLDGDGSVLMHMGGLATVGTSGAANYWHIVLNNGAHGSVGGQPTAAFDISLTGVAAALGYRHVRGPLRTIADVREAVAALPRAKGPAFIEIRVGHDARADLGRPQETARRNKEMFMEELRRYSHD